MTNHKNDSTLTTQQEKSTTRAGRDRTAILESMPIKNAIWKLAIPTMLAMLIQTIYNMTDTFFIGRLHDPNMVAAISICMPIAFLVQALGNIFAIGGASLISRLLGEGQRENANHAASISFWSALVMMVLTTIVALIFTEPILRICGASEATMPYCKVYLFILMLGGPFMGLQMAMGGLLRSEGATKESMIGMMSGSILNMVLDPIMILLLGMGITGAALATTIGNMVAFSYFVLFYLRKKGIISIALKHFRFEKHYFIAIFKIGIPASISMILMSVGMIIANVYAAGFGDDVVAGNGVVMRVTNVVIRLTMGLGQGIQPLLGYNYGAKRYDRLFETIRRAGFSSVLMSTVFGSIFYIFSEAWIRVFINDPEVVRYGVTIMRAIIISMPFTGIQMIFMTTFQSLGKSIQSLVVSLGRQGLFYIPALILFSAIWGFDGFVWARPFGDIFTAFLSIILFYFMRRSLVQEMESETYETGAILQPERVYAKR